MSLLRKAAIKKGAEQVDQVEQAEQAQLVEQQCATDSAKGVEHVDASSDKPVNASSSIDLRVLGEAQKIDAYKEWIENKPRIKDLATKYNVKEYTMTKVLREMQLKANEQANVNFEKDLSLLLSDSVDAYKHFRDIFLRDIAQLDREAQDAEERGDIKERDRKIKLRNDLMYRAGSNQIALSSTFKQVGVGIPAAGAQGTPGHSPSINFIQFLIKDNPKAQDSPEIFNSELLKKAKELTEYIEQSAEQANKLIDCEIEIVESNNFRHYVEETRESDAEHEGQEEDE